MNHYALYLRKSRADLDAEARGEGETLAKHRAALTDYAHRRGLLIVREYAEIVSGDSIAARPQMQQLLADVKAGMYTGVIVNDIDRLGRGDSIDQEIIKLTFAAAHCIIVTPGRDIDPANPTDDDMLDFSMFFARLEYKKISQRMAQGRARSAAAGNFIVPRPPYGYRKTVIDGRCTLEPDPDTAPIVHMIFDWYASGELGYTGIAHRLTDMGLRTYMGAEFSGGTVKQMLTNPAYIGSITWGSTRRLSVIVDGQREKKTQRKLTPNVCVNAHPAIIDEITFCRVQTRMRDANHVPPVNWDADLQNPLSGILKCSICGRTMKTHHSGKAKDQRTIIYIACPSRTCQTVGTRLEIVEFALLEILRDWCAEYADVQPEPDPAPDAAQIAALTRQLETISTRLARARELVELGAYTPEEYIEQKGMLTGQRESVQAQLEAAKHPPVKRTVADILPEINSVLDAYPIAQNCEQKNTLLKSIIDHAVYAKTKHAKKGEDPAQYLSLEIYPRLTGSL